eukprot:gene12372-12459_t
MVTIILTRCWPLLVLLAAPVLASWPALIGDTDPLALTSGLVSSARPGLLPGVWTLDLNAGITTQALGHLAAGQWLAGEVPWWNPYTGIGMPLAGQMQGAPLFLPFVLLLHLDNGPLLLKLVLQAIAGMSCFALLQALAAGRLASLLGGLLFALSGTFAWLSHGPMMPVAFLPLFLLGIERAREAGHRLIAVAVALSILAGFPETAYLDGLLALLWFFWRLRTHPQPWVFARRVMAGGVIGLALAAPALWSFLHLVLNGTVENHAALSGILDPLPSAVPKAAMATWLFPALFGPILAFPDRAGGLAQTVGYLGGFFGILPVLLALLGLWQTRLRGLRLALVGWIVLGIGGVAALPGLGHLFYAIPLMRQAIAARYAIVGWEMAIVVLAGLAIDDWRRGDLARDAILRSAVLMAALSAGALALGWPLLDAIRQEHAGFLRWPLGSVLWAGMLSSALLALAARSATRRRCGLLAALVVIEAAGWFALPLLSAPRDVVIDRPAVAYLKANAGLQRFYSMGPYRANYGAYFETAQLNHELLPLPANWSAHVQTALDPTSHPIMFRGDEPPSPGHAEQLRRNLAHFEALGVRYVVAPAGQDPFSADFASAKQSTLTTSRALFPGQSIAGVIDGAVVRDGDVVTVALSLGTYLGQADGDLVVELCTPAACRGGRLALAQAQDNAMARITLDAPLRVREGEDIRFRLDHEGGSQAVAVWLPQAERSPRLVIGLQQATPHPDRVYADALLEIYRLPDAAPYFESPCAIVIQDRRRLQADCETPSRLVRRELFFPGWRATVNGAEVQVSLVDQVLQAVKLPAGHSEIRFSYAPPYAWLCWIISALGAAGLIAVRVGRRLDDGQHTTSLHNALSAPKLR